MRAQADELPQITPDVDYTEILPIQQKRTIAFVNHFVMNAVSYLNHFAQSCESRFMEFEYKLQKIEASLLILEAQLSSIPELEKANRPTENSSKENDTNRSISNISTEVTSMLPEIPKELEEKALTPEDTNVTLPESEKSSEAGTRARDDPRYSKFFKMLRVGVQEEAVKLKMRSEGFDPNILDNPDALMPEPDVIPQNV